jgi:hypothetical protein
MKKTLNHVAAIVACAWPMFAMGQTSGPAAGAPAAPPATANTGAQTNTTAAVALTSGMAVKDSSGATIGQVASLQADASGKQMATIKMGTDTFNVAAADLGVQNGAAVINMTQAQISAMLHKPKS